MKTPQGRVIGLRRSIVKSFASQTLGEIYIDKTGFQGDRRFAFIDEARKARGSSPYVTARQSQELLRIASRIVAEPRNNAPYPQGYFPQVELSFPNGQRHLLDSEETLSHVRSLSKHSEHISLSYAPKGFFDQFPVSLVGQQTVQEVAAELHVHPSPWRYRMNVVVDWETHKPRTEDTLVGRNLRVGNAVLHVAKRDERCKLIGYHYAKAEHDRTVLDGVRKDFGGSVGVYLSVMQSGSVSLGDIVQVL